MSNKSCPPANRLQVEEVVQLVHTIWEVVLGALTLGSIDRCKRETRGEPRGSYDAWVIHYGDGDKAEPISLPDGFERAHMKWMACDTFCYTMLEPLRKLLDKYNAKVKYVQVQALPKAAIERANDPEPHVNYSFLRIILYDARQMCFDGTMEQFWWDAETYLISKEEFKLSRTNSPEPWHDMEADLAKDLEDTLVQKLMDYKDGYLLYAGKHIGTLLESLDWTELATMSLEARLEEVKREADAVVQKSKDDVSNA